MQFGVTLASVPKELSPRRTLTSPLPPDASPGTRRAHISGRPRSRTSGGSVWRQRKIIFSHAKAGSLGIQLENDNNVIKIKGVIQGGPAADVVDVVPGLRLLMINDISVEGWPFKMVTERIKAARRPINLQFGTNPPPTFDHPEDFKESYIIFMLEEDISIGIMLESDSICARIKSIMPNGPAAEVPGLTPGMRIKNINDMSVEGWPFSLVTQRIQNSGRPIKIIFATVPATGEKVEG